MPIPHNILMALWAKALESTSGIAIRTDNRGSLRPQLYKARQRSHDARYETLEIALPPNQEEIWIVHKPQIFGAAKVFDESDLDSL